ncbi:MAG: response regulator [Kangiellaceae bacterium]|nr:response regulator [Kangiellaceae bacterium]
MSGILVVDDSKRILANTAEQLKSAGYDFEYFSDYKSASNYLRLNRPKIKLVLFSLSNSLGYPVLRKLKSTMSDRATVIVCSDMNDKSINDWVQKMGIEYYFEPEKQQRELLNRIKRSMFKTGKFFTDHQLNHLIKALSKYTNGAEALVKEIAPKSKSLQELQHKLARRLDGIDAQRKFLTEVQS